MKLNIKILGIDYGDAKVGLALSADSLALPFKVLLNRSTLLDDINEIVTNEGIKKVVVGLPLGYMGEETPSSLKIKNFSIKLQKELNIPVDLFDERLTTAQVKSMQVKGEDDAHAAALILQSYIDKHELDI